jgi:hypothetical protein
MADIHGFAYGVSHDWLRASYIHALAVVTSAVVFGWTTFRGRHHDDSSRLFLIAIPCALLVSHHTYIHDLSVLLLPAVVVLNLFLPSEAVGSSRERWIARTAAFMLVAPVVESYAPDHFYIVAVPLGAMLLATSAAFASTKKSEHAEASHA